jgi:catechol 2,3-dioxygenase-like lactoylglutathione lyase family enzyme
VDWKLEVIILPVADIERAKHFYSEQVGFVVDHDTEIGSDFRVIQLTPRGSGCSIVISQDNKGMVPGSLKGLQLVVDDIQAARAELLAKGVEVSTVKHYEGTSLVDGPDGPWNAFVFFSDPDGNAWVIQERPSSH